MQSQIKEEEYLKLALDYLSRLEQKYLKITEEMDEKILRNFKSADILLR